MAQRFAVCFRTCDSVLLAHLDIWAERFPDVLPAGLLHQCHGCVRCSHGPTTQIEFIYNAIQLLFTWTSLANFYLAFFFVRFWLFCTIGC